MTGPNGCPRSIVLEHDLEAGRLGRRPSQSQSWGEMRETPEQGPREGEVGGAQRRGQAGGVGGRIQGTASRAAENSEHSIFAYEYVCASSSLG